jgi:hypothetical protein
MVDTNIPSFNHCAKNSLSAFQCTLAVSLVSLFPPPLDVWLNPDSDRPITIPIFIPCNFCADAEDGADRPPFIPPPAPYELPAPCTPTPPAPVPAPEPEP